MYILIVANSIPTFKRPLSGIFEFDQAKALAQEGNKIVFLAIDLCSVRRWRKWGIVKGKKDGIPFYVYNFPGGRMPVKWLCKIGEFCLKRVYKVVIDSYGKPDIIHAHFTEMGCMTARLSKYGKIPYVMTEHSSKMHQMSISGGLKECALEAYKNAKKVIAVSSSLSDSIFKHTGVSSVVVPNIIDTDIFYSSHLIQHDGFNLVTTSNLIHLKRTRQILQGMSLLDCNRINCKLTIIGEGPERDSIDNLSKKLNLSNRVKIVGYKTRSEIAKIYECSDCFILVSSSETFGVAYVEAMAAGLPVIATKCGGPEDFVNESNGILVDVDNIEQIANAIMHIYDKRQEYHKDEIKNNVWNKFSSHIIAEELLDIYKSILCVK